MEEHLKQFGVWAGLGAALGLGLRALALGALVGVGAGAVLGAATALTRRGADEAAAPAFEPTALH